MSLQEITRRVSEAVRSLPSDCLIRDPQSTMFDAMNSLEIMDPKMDTGIRHAMSAAPAVPLFDPNVPLSAEEACWIIDEMITREMAWHRGQMLSQTVLCSMLYHLVENQYAVMPSLELLDQHSLVAHLLAHYTILYRQCIDLAYNELAKGTVKEGEDCMLDHADMPLQSCETVERACECTVQLLGLLSHDLDSHDTWTRQLLLRLRIRGEILAGMDSVMKDLVAPLFDGSFLSFSEDNLSIPDSPGTTSRCPTFFDDGIESALPQNMPPPTQALPSHHVAASHLINLLETLRKLHDMRSVFCVNTWRALCTGIARQHHSSSLEISLAKTAISAALPDGQDRRQLMFDQLLSLHTNISLEKILAVPALIKDPKDRIKFGVWWDSVRGCTLSYASIALHNSSRERRAYLSLSSAWSDRVATTHNLSQYPPVGQLNDLLHGLRLDCLLSAYLMSWQSGIVAADEELQTWWIVAQISAFQLRLKLRETVERRRAVLWHSVATGMCLVLARTAGQTLGSSLKGRAQFALRHKVAMRRPRPASNMAIGDEFVPSYAYWSKHFHVLLGLRDCGLASARRLFNAAIHQLGCDDADALASVVPASSLLDDLGSMLAELRRDGASTWDGTRLHLLPNVQQY